MISQGIKNKENDEEIQTAASAEELATLVNADRTQTDDPLNHGEYLDDGNLEVVVFWLSLMGKNWREYMAETKRCPCMRFEVDCTIN